MSFAKGEAKPGQLLLEAEVVMLRERLLEKDALMRGLEHKLARLRSRYERVVEENERLVKLARKWE